MNTVPNKNAVLNPVKVFDKDTLLHLRIPFSFYLLPVFCFGFSQASHIEWTNFVLVFIALHFFIYPGSNVYNSYMDKDTGSIGGLKTPPPATPKMYYASIWLDTSGIALSLIIGWQFALIIMIYIAISKAYSWQGIRLKKYPILSWIIVSLFQGGYTYMLVNMSVTGNISFKWFTQENVLAFIIASLLVGGFYPLTQVYQHEEDSKRGDRTISYMLGVKGTFIFSAAIFGAATAAMFTYFNIYYSMAYFLIFITCLLPVSIYFVWWFLRVIADKEQANFSGAMGINQVSALCMITCFCIIAYLNQL